MNRREFFQKGAYFIACFAAGVLGRKAMAEQPALKFGDKLEFSGSIVDARWSGDSMEVYASSAYMDGRYGRGPMTLALEDLKEAKAILDNANVPPANRYFYAFGDARARKINREIIEAFQEDAEASLDFNRWRAGK